MFEIRGLSRRTPCEAETTTWLGRSGTRLIAAVAVGVMTLAGALSVGGAAGSVTGPTVSISPTSGPIGTVITVSGTCPSGDGAMVQLSQGDVNVFIFTHDLTVSGTGEMSGTIVIPAEHPLSPTAPGVMVPVNSGDTFDVYSNCGPAGAAVYASEQFTVTDSPATTMGSTTTPATTQPAFTPTTTVPLPGVSTEEQRVQVGGTVHLTGDGFAPSTPLTIDLHSTPVRIGSVRSTAKGTFATTVTIPRDVTPGVHEIVVTGKGADGSTRVVRTPITVTAPAATPASPVTAAPTFTG